MFTSQVCGTLLAVGWSSSLCCVPSTCQNVRTVELSCPARVFVWPLVSRAASWTGKEAGPASSNVNISPWAARYVTARLINNLLLKTEPCLFVTLTELRMNYKLLVRRLCAERGAEAEVQHIGPVRSPLGEDGHSVELVQGCGGLRHPM